MGINNLRTKVLLLFKLIHIMDDHKLETIQQTEVKRRMPSACCYLAQDFFLLSPPTLAGIVLDEGKGRRNGNRTPRWIDTEALKTLNLQILFKRNFQF